MNNLIVVGGGIVGSVIARYSQLSGLGLSTVIDSGFSFSASPAAACLLKESWLPKGHYSKSMEILTKLATPRTVTFQGQPGSASCFTPEDLMVKQPVRDTVQEVSDGYVRCISGKEYRGTVVVAAGVWTKTLLNVDVHGMAGMALIYPNQTEPKYKVWAPYKQIISFPIREGRMYVSDGTAVRVWNHTLTKRLHEHAKDVGLTGPSTFKIGMRPYTKEKPKLIRISKNLWVATGTRKSGTVLSALWAEEFVRYYKK